MAASFAASTLSFSFFFFFCSLLSPLPEPTTLTSSRSSAPNADRSLWRLGVRAVREVVVVAEVVAPKHRPLQVLLG